MSLERAEITGIRLYPAEKEIAVRYAEANGLNMSAAIRHILREWNALNKAGIYVSELPHPSDATAVPVIHIGKREIA